MHFRHLSQELLNMMMTSMGNAIMCGQSQHLKLNLVLAYGKSRQGWEALVALFQDVTIHDVQASAKFFEFADNGDRTTNRCFLAASNGRSVQLLLLTQNIYILFDAGVGFFSWTPLDHRILFMPALRNLETLTFDILEYDNDHAFQVFADPGMDYPPSLHTVQMISASTDVGKVSLFCSSSSFANM